MTPQPISYYTEKIRPRLPPEAFVPVRSTAGWAALHTAIVGLGIAAIALDVGGLPGRWLFALLIGHSFAGLAFVGHEALHGAVVRGRWRIHALGYLCFLPFAVSPRLWSAWHNKVHHGNTMNPAIDPDVYPTLEEYRASRLLRIVDLYSLGRGHHLGILSLFLGFTVQHFQILFGRSRQPTYLSASQRRWALAETTSALALWALLCAQIGIARFLFAYVIPLLVGNAIVTAYILTNHSLSQLAPEVNDPLLNSLSVTVPKPVALLHLNFGLHVEHHLFPAMSSRYAGHVRAALKEEWPERYQSMSFLGAMWRLARTPRVYLDETTLVDPRSGQRFPTVGARSIPAARAPAGEGVRSLRNRQGPQIAE